MSEATVPRPARAFRRRTDEEILSGLVCAPTEAMRVLNVRYAKVIDLIESGRVGSFRVGRRTKVSVESLRALARGDVAAPGEKEGRP